MNSRHRTSSGMKRRAVVAPFAIAKRTRALLSKNNTFFFIRDNRLKKGGGDLDGKGDRRNFFMC